MEPLKPEVKKFLLEVAPQADPTDVEEYERLLADRFTVDPDRAKAPEAMSADEDREVRLAELHKKLFSKS
jgi:hypothetical protein